jgi:hypothetical protein
VVLPDPKLPGTDKDLVIWLPQGHAAAAEEEAEQRGAVAALHVVAGDRSLDYLLPKGYRPLWGALGQEVRGGGRGGGGWQVVVRKYPEPDPVCA